MAASAHDSYFSEVEARFEDGTDFSVGLEEEFQILDRETLALNDGFERLRDAAPPALRERILGELIASEIEIATPKGADFSEAARDAAGARDGLFGLAADQGFALGATGTHPFSHWQDQRIIDTPHYRLVEERLQYVAWRNNTWSFHVHVGVRGCDRAVAACDALRVYLPYLLALSANSPFIEGVWTRLHSARAQTFVRMFPRCGVPDVFGTWTAHRGFYEELLDTDCLQEFTQVWWSVRPHHKYGTVEIRICDAQTELWQTLAIAALAVGLTALVVATRDEGGTPATPPTRYVEENFWRAIRFGLDGDLVDFERRRQVPAAEAIRDLVARVRPLAGDLGIGTHLDDVERLLAEGNGAQRQTRSHVDGRRIREVFAETVERAFAERGR